MAYQDPAALALPTNGVLRCWAVVTSFSMTPLDVVKVRLQSQPLRDQRADASLQTLEPLLHQIALLSPTHREVPPVPQWYPGAPVPVPRWCPLCHLVSGSHSLHWHHGCLYEDCETQSPRTLWSGLPATLVMTVTATAICFNYDQLKAFLSGQTLTSELCVSMVAGPLAPLGHRDCDQPPGAGADEAAGSACVILGAGCLCPRSRGSGQLALTVAGLGPHCPAGCVLRSPVLVQL